MIYIPDLIPKYKRLEGEFEHLHCKLQAIVLWFSRFLYTNYACLPIWTSFYRKGSRGVHGYLRGADASRRVVDLRTPGERRLLTYREALAIKLKVNSRFPYTKTKKTCIYHNAGSGLHFHIQVRP